MTNTNLCDKIFFPIFLFKRLCFFLAVPYVKVAELVTQLGDAKHEECLCLVLERHAAALWLHEHILYFGMTSASFSTQGCLIWEGIGLWRRKLLWVTCECHRCHWCSCDSRGSEESLIGEAEGWCAGETDALLLVWAAVGSIQAFSVCRSLRAVFFL